MSAPAASPRSVCPSASQGWASRATGPRSPGAPYQTSSVFGRYEKSGSPWTEEGSPHSRTSGPTSCPPAPAPNAGSWSLTAIYPERAQGAAEVSEGRPKLRARGRLPLAASAGSSVRQSKGARSRGMPARQLPAAQAAASCGGRRGSDVHAHHRRSRGCPPAAALFPGGWAAQDSQGPPGPTRHPVSFLHCARTHAQRPRPALHAPALPPAAEALVRLKAGVRSAPLGARPCPAPSHRAPPPVPAHPYPPCGPCPSQSFGGLCASSG